MCLKIFFIWMPLFGLIHSQPVRAMPDETITAAKARAEAEREFKFKERKKAPLKFEFIAAEFPYLTVNALENAYG